MPRYPVPITVRRYGTSELLSIAEACYRPSLSRSVPPAPIRKPYWLVTRWSDVLVFIHELSSVLRRRRARHAPRDGPGPRGREDRSACRGDGRDRGVSLGRVQGARRGR